MTETVSERTLGKGTNGPAHRAAATNLQLVKNAASGKAVRGAWAARLLLLLVRVCEARASVPAVSSPELRTTPGAEQVHRACCVSDRKDGWMDGRIVCFALLVCDVTTARHFPTLLTSLRQRNKVQPE